MALSETARNGYAVYTKNEIAYARYKVGSVYYKTNVDRFEFPKEEPGTLNVWLVINHPVNKTITIAEIQLFDTGGNLFLNCSESIVVDAAQEGVLYKIRFQFKEEEAN